MSYTGSTGFRKPDCCKLTFAQAREAWLDRWQADIRLTHADRALCIQIYRHFNRSHYEDTRELLAWPSWNTIARRAKLSEPSIRRGFRKLERLGALEIIHGGRDVRTGWNLANKYLAPPVTLTGGHPSNRHKSTGQDDGRLVDSDSLNKDDSLSLSKREETKIWNSREERKSQRHSKLSNSKPSLKNPTPPGSARPRSPRREERWWQERREAEETLARYRAAKALAENGDGR